MDIEQWLADLEAKAENTGQKKWVPVTKEYFGDISCDVEGEKNAVVAFDLPPRVAEFIAAANPAAVLRLVGMVRHLAVGCDCDEADQQMKAKLERLEKEADWLANHLNSTFVGQCRFCREGIKQCTAKCECTKTWRDLAREAVEKETCPKN